MELNSEQFKTCPFVLPFPEDKVKFPHGMFRIDVYDRNQVIKTFITSHTHFFQHLYFEVIPVRFYDDGMLTPKFWTPNLRFYRFHEIYETGTTLYIANAHYISCNVSSRDILVKQGKAKEFLEWCQKKYDEINAFQAQLPKPP